MTDLSDAHHCMFKAKASTQQKNQLEMDKFWFTNTGKHQPNASDRGGDMSYSREVAKICSVILYESISATQQVLALFKAV